MSSARNLIAVAREMMARHGSDAASMMERRAQENAEAGDSEAAAFWAQVVQAIRAMGAKPARDQSKACPAFEATPHPYLLLSPNFNDSECE